ncbi:unnamed protein product [Meganyctiphanes norvegica]|uniref:Uncharacterized protein n=1 Tax=Meganyctiphanes norvegica TaxID=48144 RepID=A0AAV2Q391_MEGNR
MNQTVYFILIFIGGPPADIKLDDLKKVVAYLIHQSLAFGRDGNLEKNKISREVPVFAPTVILDNDQGCLPDLSIEIMDEDPYDPLFKPPQTPTQTLHIQHWNSPAGTSSAPTPTPKGDLLPKKTDCTHIISESSHFQWYAAF